MMAWLDSATTPSPRLLTLLLNLS